VVVIVCQGEEDELVGSVEEALPEDGEGAGEGGEPEGEQEDISDIEWREFMEKIVSPCDDWQMAR
jgi:hypothetical protein